MAKRTALVKRNWGDLANGLGKLLIGQDAAIQAVVPFVQLYQASLAPEGRPAGVVALLGPTGTGKTRTVEALAEVLHGSRKKILKIDCGEFQMDHEIAKLIGAPPGYLGHRETTPMLTQLRLAAVTSDSSDLSIVLFDEIEKAAPPLARLLLGVLDKGTLRLGDNTVVNFEKTMIFLTSNLGGRNMVSTKGYGFQAAPQMLDYSRLEAIALSAIKKHYAPEFVNRLDAIVTYSPLSGESLVEILDMLLGELQDHIRHRLGARAFILDVTGPVRQFLLRTGSSAEFGARELKRTIHREIMRPLAELLSGYAIEPGSPVIAEMNRARSKVILRAEGLRLLEAA